MGIGKSLAVLVVLAGLVGAWLHLTDEISELEAKIILVWATHPADGSELLEQRVADLETQLAAIWSDAQPAWAEIARLKEGEVPQHEKVHAKLESDVHDLQDDVWALVD